MTGVVALLLGANNRLRADSIVTLLKGSADAATPTRIDVDAVLAKVEAERGSGRLARSAH
jgi:hypothetical protein